VATLRLRWSEHEARKPYARPFMVSFVDDAGADLGSVALNGSDLLYWRQFGVAVAALSGELFLFDAVDSAADPQRAWLETLITLMPSATVTQVTPRSSFDHQTEMHVPEAGLELIDARFVVDDLVKLISARAALHASSSRRR